MRVKQPVNVNPAALLPRNVQHNQGRSRPLSLDLVYRTTTQFEILPGLDNFNDEMIQIWVKGRVHNFPFTRGLTAGITNTHWRVDISTAGINGTTFIGGRLDGLALQASTRYLIWLITNEANTALVGYGITRRPQADFTAISTGAKDGLAVLTLAGTGLNNAFQFTIGARVLLRTGNGTTPNFNFNWGIVTAISSNTSMTVQLDNRVQDGSTTITVGGTSEILQFDRFVPRSSVTLGTQYSSNYRLIGELVTDVNSQIVFIRRADDPYTVLEFQYPQINIASGQLSYRSFRYVPYWTKELLISLLYVKTSAGTIGRVVLNVPNRLNGVYGAASPFEIAAVADGSSTISRVAGIRVHTATAGLFQVQTAVLAGGGDMTCTPIISGYWDGGVRE